MEGDPMRARLVVTIIAIAVLAVATKLIFFPLKNAEAITSQTLDVQQMHKDANMQRILVQDVNDMSLVFDRNN
jgi:cytochrome c-type biogenesis protein CcmE